MASVLGVSLTSSLLPLFSSKSNTRIKSSSRNVFLHPNGLKSNNFSCSGLKLNVGINLNSVIVRCESDAVAEIEATETSSENYEYQAEGATIDLKLPRRSLLAHFTCNACGVRSQKLINRLAYEKGTVFVQGVRSITNLLTILILWYSTTLRRKSTQAPMQINFDALCNFIFS
ncbi:uncharacterized protein [Rutidosis leptorrhynchoides]|uniref:uncharacterized protein n=1 Tax=Rutidosis leptorrhynchoides TaxID=125765 RepID=UPI003A98D25B